MIDKFTSAICKAIKTELPELKVYKDTSQISVFEKCFSVLPINNVRTRKGVFVYDSKYAFVVNYFADTHEVYSDCIKVYERLCDALESIIVDGKRSKCNEFGYNIDDGVLSVNVTYDIRLIESADDTDKMYYYHDVGKVD